MHLNLCDVIRDQEIDKIDQQIQTNEPFRRTYYRSLP